MINRIQQIQYDGTEGSFLNIKNAISDAGGVVVASSQLEGEEPEVYMRVFEGNGSRYNISVRPGEFVTRANGEWYVTHKALTP
jgi:hypothetical protein